jgi:hypothetical protein
MITIHWQTIVNQFHRRAAFAARAGNSMPLYHSRETVLAKISSIGVMSGMARHFRAGGAKGLHERTVSRGVVISHLEHLCPLPDPAGEFKCASRRTEWPGGWN